MTNLKHLGRIKKTGRKCLVVFRTLPGDAFSCLVLQTENLTPDYHDQLINLVESPSGQSAYEFAEVLARGVFSDGSTMLASLHVKGFLTKVPTDQVEMLPNNQTSILLADLNQIIAEQRGVSVQDLAIRPEKEAVEVQEIAKISDISNIQTSEDTEAIQEQSFTSTEDEAKHYRSQADKLSKQAADLRRRAEELVPTKKKQLVKSE
jgi:hypothetical protein